MRLGLLVSLLALGSSGAQIFVEAERFAEKGGWAVDSQFIDLMGSSFLLAHGMGRPVDDARTELAVAEAGTYKVYAYTRNWTAPWTEHAAGTFRIRVNGETLPNALGTGSGDWRWQLAGTVTLPAGKAELALHDLTGFDGRCDAVCLTTDASPRRPPAPAVAAEKTYDFVVCGGGIAGTCAAISAARLGLKVALVQDRPMLGGANSSEVRVHLGGFMNLGPYPRLGDVVSEIGPAKGGNARPAATYEDGRKLAVVAAEPNIDLFLDTRATEVEMTADGKAIAAVIGRHVVDGSRIRFAAPLFADCTGDACVGALAGADFRMGRESRAQTGEDMAPEVADRMTMGASVQWYTRETAADAPFPMRPWMIAFDERNCEHATRGDWDWETGMLRDQIAEFERIRDYGMLVAYSNWAFLKNKSAKKAKYAKREFEWVAFVAGKRESRRLLGDHILTQQDVFDFKPYPDASFATTWAIDLHYPMPSNQKHYPGEPFRSICTHNRHHAYPVPYRCLYSRNVENLFMAGRNISVTHVALGTVRVMRTTGMMGEVVGMAARVCKTHGCRPRGVYAAHLDELKALMAKGVGTGRPQPPQNYNRGSMLPGAPKDRGPADRP
ncbi:MAG: FAD-dependent oxidoreductase [Kiritimatiellia bacterium]